ncbi:MAG: Gfo/Idh/MocA family oxidoreductase [Deltaproteobacteria bacterium]|nr:Gfo/Idh/MocA family oxidoreductase [Deltaproteobacteria bacterium]MBI3754878.1 Gfo/Idh/MocA family oxidoreductase [Deltaproteobacteria bacterium]
MRIKVGVVGVGYLGKFHAEKYSSLPHVELVGVVDTDKKRADEIAAGLKTKAFYSYRDILSKDTVDAVSIVVPTSLHYKIAKDFLSNGIDALLEKPITNILQEADELIMEAKKNKAILQVGHLERFNAAVMAMNGIVNNPMFIESYRLSPFPNRGADVDVILDMMIHDIDIILNFVKSEIGSVDAVGIPVITGKVDIANARIKFQNGCVSNITASRVSKERVRKIQLFQDDAYISIDYANQNMAVCRKVGGGGREFPQIVEKDMRIEKTDTLLEEIKAFVDCVISRKLPLVSGEDGKRALEVAQMIQKEVGSRM